MKRVLRLSAIVAICLLIGGTVLAAVLPRESAMLRNEPWVNVATPQPPGTPVGVSDTPGGGPIPITEGAESTTSPSATTTTSGVTKPTSTVDAAPGTGGSGNQGSDKGSDHGHGRSVDPPEPGHGQGRH